VGYGEKEVMMGTGMEGKGLISSQDDGDSGKWEKGFGIGPGYGGRRGLPPRQKRTPGWVRPSTQ
jgi:dolichyl-phosphate-mannose-protein mannosyltransferase